MDESANLIQTGPFSQPEYQVSLGRQVETAALARALGALGVLAPHTRQPFSEALLFGIGGGLGLGYFVYESAASVSLFLGTRVMTAETPEQGFVHAICARLGIPAILQTAGNPALAERKLIRALESGSPVLVWVDPRDLPYYGTPNAYHALLVHGYDRPRTRFLAVDRCATQVVITANELSAARQGDGAPRYRALVIEPPAVGLDLVDAVRTGLREGLAQLQNGFGPENVRNNFGLRSLGKWADLLTNSREARGWPKFLPPGERLFAAQVSLYEQIANRGADDAALRPLYADFVKEAAVILEKPAIAETAPLYEASAQAWRELAAALLPANEPLFTETLRQVAARKQIFEKNGNDALEATHSTEIRLAELRGLARDKYPLKADQVKAWRLAVRQKVLAVQACEEQAVQALSTAMQ